MLLRLHEGIDMIKDFPLGHRSNPYEEIVLIDAITKSCKLGRALYARVEDDSGLYKVYPDGEAILIKRGRKKVCRKEVNFSIDERRLKR